MGEVYKYLGIALPGDLRSRGRTTLSHRLRCAWAKFDMFRTSLTNRHVDVRLRMKLFDAVVTPSVLYGLTAMPLTARDEDRLAIAQRKMLRQIVGYVKASTDTWADMYRSLKKRIRHAT